MIVRGHEDLRRLGCCLTSFRTRFRTSVGRTCVAFRMVVVMIPLSKRVVPTINPVGWEIGRIPRTPSPVTCYGETFITRCCGPTTSDTTNGSITRSPGMTARAYACVA